MENNKDIILTEDYLKEIIDYTSSCLVGKICKRFEIVANRDILKSEVKELVYEEFRKFRDILKAYKYGLEVSLFKFNNKK